MLWLNIAAETRLINISTHLIFILYSEMGAILKTAYEYRFNDVVVITVLDKMAHFRKGKVVTNAAFHKKRL